MDSEIEKIDREIEKVANQRQAAERIKLDLDRLTNDIKKMKKKRGMSADKIVSIVLDRVEQITQDAKNAGLVDESLNELLNKAKLLN
jgi:hypothetical protein